MHTKSACLCKPIMNESLYETCWQDIIDYYLIYSIHLYPQKRELSNFLTILVIIKESFLVNL